MGVKDLWNILSPLCERRPLFELQGKVIAIDLSCWIVDSQSVTDNFAQPKMYLRKERLQRKGEELILIEFLTNAKSFLNIWV